MVRRHLRRRWRTAAPADRPLHPPAPAPRPGLPPVAAGEPGCTPAGFGGISSGRASRVSAAPAPASGLTTCSSLSLRSISSGTDVSVNEKALSSSGNRISPSLADPASTYPRRDRDEDGQLAVAWRRPLVPRRRRRRGSSTSPTCCRPTRAGWRCRCRRRPPRRRARRPRCRRPAARSWPRRGASPSAARPPEGRATSGSRCGAMSARSRGEKLSREPGARHQAALASGVRTVVDHELTQRDQLGGRERRRQRHRPSRVGRAGSAGRPPRSPPPPRSAHFARKSSSLLSGGIRRHQRVRVRPFIGRRNVRGDLVVIGDDNRVALLGDGPGIRPPAWRACGQRGTRPSEEAAASR